MSLTVMAQLAFWTAAALVIYSYVGYAALLVLAVRLRPAPPVRKGPFLPRVSLIVVVHNEEARLPGKIRNCLDLDYPKDRFELLVVSDGSTDRTEEIAASYLSHGVRLLCVPGPSGKPAALNRAVPECTGEVLMLGDARQRLAPDAIGQLVSNLADPTIGAVTGELHIGTESGSGAAEGVGAYWEYEKLIRRAESRLDSTVGVTGAIYAVRKELFRPLDPRTILDDVAIPMAVVQAGYRVVFEPLAKAYDDSAAEPTKEYRRKVRTLAGNFQLVRLDPGLLNPGRNRLFWQFLSHKLSRLAVPWCLLLMLLASALQFRRSFYGAIFAGQVVFYLMGLAGWLLEGAQVRLRVLSLPYAFALLNLAAASSLFGFLLGRHRAAWKGLSS
jgi:poly-beta-1,6-N-acetyl-D-glucosamine synthase